MEAMLYQAASRGEVDKVRQLCATDIDVNWCEGGDKGDRRTPLYAAAKGGFAEVVKVLLDAGADVTSATSDWTSPLHAAAWNGHTGW